MFHNSAVDWLFVDEVWKLQISIQDSSYFHFSGLYDVSEQIPDPTLPGKARRSQIYHFF